MAKNVKEQKNVKEAGSVLYAFHTSAVQNARQALKDDNMAQRFNRSAHGMQTGVFARNGTPYTKDGQPDCAIKYVQTNNLLDANGLATFKKFKEEDKGIEYLKQNGIACAIIAVAYQRSLVAVQSVKRQGKAETRVRPNPHNPATLALTQAAMLKMTKELAQDATVPTVKAKKK
jgi:hypothetical protein